MSLRSTKKREPRFEALVFTSNRELAARCARAFADFPVDWVMLYEPSFALEYLAKERFDYVILDLDSVENSSILIDAIESGVNLKSVVLAATSAAVSPVLLDLCYRSRIFYPVRPTEIQEQLYRTVPLAERLANERRELDVVSAKDERECTHAVRSPYWANLTSVGIAQYVRSVLNMKHSLTIEAQERVASLVASFGTIWFVREMTQDFRGVEFIQPPSVGPTYLIAVAVLFWLCAKQRRLNEGTTASVVPIQRGKVAIAEEGFHSFI